MTYFECTMLTRQLGTVI